MPRQRCALLFVSSIPYFVSLLKTYHCGYGQKVAIGYHSDGLCDAVLQGNAGSLRPELNKS